MLKHYLTVAFRNLWKYKTQSVISIIGLAVGFTCFALATLWIRYEMTYDTFYKKADRIYTVSTPNSFSNHGYARENPYPLAAYLKKMFPEVTNACNNNTWSWGSLKIDSVKYPASIAHIDSSFLTMFDITVIEGNLDFLIPESKKIAITKEKAKAIFHGESPLGKEVSYDNNETGLSTICAVVNGGSKHSNYPFDVLVPIVPPTARIWDWGWNYETLIELSPGVDVATFKDKLYELEIEREGTFKLSKIKITPLTTMHYEDPDNYREIKFAHIVLFAFAGTLVILCALFNYLTLFVCRFKIREKEFALRMVSGASGRSLFSLWSVEFLMTQVPAFLLSLVLIIATLSPFKKLSQIEMDISSIYLEAALYIGSIIAIALLVFIGVLFLFRKKSLNTSIRKSNKNLFRKISIVFQLVISIVFIFCTTVMIKQLYFLHHTDLGFTFKNTGSVQIMVQDMSEETYLDYWATFKNQLRQIPEITETIEGYNPLMPVYSQTTTSIYDWDDKPSDVEGFNIHYIDISKQYAEFYALQLIEGEMLSEDEPRNNILLNESAVKFFGWEHPIGKKIDRYTVKGVIRNIYKSLPTVPVQPFFYAQNKGSQNYNTMTSANILFKYQEGKWESCKSKIEALIKKEEYARLSIHNAEEGYDWYFKSENALLKMLSLLSLVCVAISVFGFFSLISLSCEERRKEIAIRKINGATMRDILNLYFKTYFALLITGAIIAFPIGYFIMKQWIEKYVKQTDISAWIYITILLVMTSVIVLCVGWRVYKASVENPAEVIKSE